MTEVQVPFSPHTIRDILGFTELEEIPPVMTWTSQVSVEIKEQKKINGFAENPK